MRSQKLWRRSRHVVEGSREVDGRCRRVVDEVVHYGNGGVAGKTAVARGSAVFVVPLEGFRRCAVVYLVGGVRRVCGRGDDIQGLFRDERGSRGSIVYLVLGRLRRATPMQYSVRHR